MGPHRVVVLPPLFDNYFRFLPISKPLHGQALVAELAIEALRSPVLPWLARGNQGDVERFSHSPAQERPGHKLRAIVGTQTLRGSALADQARKHFNHTARTDAPGNIEGQALSSDLIDNAQALQLLPVGAGSECDVVCPDLVGATQSLGLGGRRHPACVVVSSAPGFLLHTSAGKHCPAQSYALCAS